MENDRKIGFMKDGTEIKPLYIQNFSLADWELVKRAQDSFQIDTVANVIRLAVRKLAGAA